MNPFAFVRQVPMAWPSVFLFAGSRWWPALQGLRTDGSLRRGRGRRGPSWPPDRRSTGAQVDDESIELKLTTKHQQPLGGERPRQCSRATTASCFPDRRIVPSAAIATGGS